MIESGGVEPINDRPTGTIQLLDGGFAAIRQRPQVIMGLTLVLVTPISLLDSWLRRNNLSLPRRGEFDPFASFTLFDVAGTASAAVYVFQLLVVLAVGVGVSRVVDGWNHGVDTTLGQALRFVARRSWVIIAVFVLNHLAQLVGFVMLFLPGVAAIVFGALCAPIIAVEETTNPARVLARSWRLVSRNFGRVMGMIILLVVTQFLVSFILAIVPSTLAFVIGPTGLWPLQAAVEIVADLIMFPVTGATMGLLYLDIIYRSEGADILRRLARERHAGQNGGRNGGRVASPGGLVDG